MKVVVGLGNPGDKYRRTRHNVGFDVAAELAKRNGDPTPRTKFEAEVVEFVLGGEKVVVVRPQTFMNLSGGSVQPLVAFHHVALSDLLVVCDDLNLDVGRLRLRASGTAGGQKGLADIIRRLGSEEIPRLRIGIGRPPPRMDSADYVLGKFHAGEVDSIRDVISRAADAAEIWIREGLIAAMNRFNPAGSDEKPAGPAKKADPGKKAAPTNPPAEAE